MGRRGLRRGPQGGVGRHLTLLVQGGWVAALLFLGNAGYQAGKLTGNWWMHSVGSSVSSDHCERDCVLGFPLKALVFWADRRYRQVRFCLSV